MDAPGQTKKNLRGTRSTIRSYPTQNELFLSPQYFCLNAVHFIREVLTNIKVAKYWKVFKKFAKKFKSIKLAMDAMGVKVNLYTV